MNMLTARLNILVCLVIVSFALQPVAVVAGTITFTGNTIDLQGTGFGTTLTSLILHDNDSEFGSVLWNGAADVLTDDATNQSATRTATELATAGVNATNFSVIFNVAEAKGQGTDVTLFDFAVRFQDSTGASLFADLVYDAPVGGIVLDQVAGGVGGAGWLFNIALTPGEAAAFFGTGSNRVGMIIESSQAIQNSSGGPDGFFFAPVPEPSGVGLMVVGTVIVGLVPLRRRMRRRQ